MPQLIRSENWPTLLSQEVSISLQVPFIWGTNDCCLFVANCIHAMTDVDVADEFRFQYTDEASLQTFLGTKGLSDLTGIAEYIAAQFEMEEINPKLAQRGDVILWNSLSGLTLGIIIDNRLAAAAPDNLLLLPMDGILDDPLTRTWRV